MSGRRDGFTGAGPLASTMVTESDPVFGNVTFETGRPVEFRFIRNTEKSPKLGPRFGQDIEPSGTYLLHDQLGGNPPRGWVFGHMRFRSPLVIELSLDPDAIYGPLGWKARLQRETGKKGRALSRRLIQMGYDAVVTVGSLRGVSDTREIVELRA